MISLIIILIQNYFNILNENIDNIINHRGIRRYLYNSSYHFTCKSDNSDIIIICIIDRILIITLSIYKFSIE